MVKSLSKPDVKSLYSQLCADMEPYIMFRIAQRVADLTDELVAKGRKPIKMSIGAPTVLPPQQLRDKVKSLLTDDGLNTYSTPRGELFFRDAVAKRMLSRFGVLVEPRKEVCSLIGSKEGLAAMFRALVTPKDKTVDKDIILIPDPGYASYVDAIKIAGGLPYAVPLNAENNYMPNLDRIHQALSNSGYNPTNIKAVVINYPNNPTGALATLDYYKEVVAFARQHNILIISDIAYADMVFDGVEKPHSILEVEGAKDIAIEFHSMSKPYAITGWRLGFAVGNEDAISILATVKSTMDSGIWKVLQKAGAFALTSPDCANFITTMNRVYQENQQFMIEGFKDLGWPMDEISIPKATFYFWIPIPPRYKSCTDFATEMLEKSGIVVVPGTAFGGHGEGYVRLSLVNPREELTTVLARMKEDGFTYS
jgi:LL-diaminopimelate aminotransferase